GKPQRNQALAQHMFHRLPETEVDAQRQRRDHLSQPDALLTHNHAASIARGPAAAVTTAQYRSRLCPYGRTSRPAKPWQPHLHRGDTLDTQSESHPAAGQLRRELFGLVFVAVRAA